MKSIRMLKGLTQYEIAEPLGIAQPLVSVYENGRVPIPEDRAKRIARILGVKLDVLQFKIAKSRP